MNHPDYIHTPDDGRGRRDVFVDGVLVEGVFYADCREGFVNAYIEPLAPNRRRTGVKWRTIWGKVEVRPK